jgi:integrase
MRRRADTGKWEVRWREGGSNRSKSFTRKVDAERFKGDVKRAQELGQVLAIDGGKELLTEFVEVWWEGHVLPTCAQSTRSSYAAVWSRHVRPRLGGYRLRDITPRVVDQFKAELMTSGVGPSVVHKSLMILSGMFTCAVRWEYIDRNPLDSIKIPVPERAHHVRVSAPVTVEALRRDLLEHDRIRDAVLVSVLAYAGLRPAEARALRWGDIRERTLLVERAADATSIKSTKTRKIRSVRLLGPLADDLSGWRARCHAASADQLVFPSVRGGLWTKDGWDAWRNSVFKPTADRVGASRRPYDLRHTFASLLIAAGGTIVEIAAQLGHDPALTLGTYAHVFEEFELGSRPDLVGAIEEARREMGVREMYAELDEGDPGLLRDPSSELEADARIRTADPFITRDRRAVQSSPAGGTPANDIPARCPDCGGLLGPGIDPSGQADVRREHAGDCEGDPRVKSGRRCPPTPVRRGEHRRIAAGTSRGFDSVNIADSYCQRSCPVFVGRVPNAPPSGHASHVES